MKEIFKTISGFKDYQVSNLGKIISYKSGKWKYLRLSVDDDNYKHVTLKGCMNYKVGHLVLLTFVGPCPEGKEMSHLNRDSLNDELQNLCWETHIENVHRHAKLTKEDILEIRELLKQSYTQGYIAGIFNVSQTYISKIKLNQQWKGV